MKSIRCLSIKKCHIALSIVFFFLVPTLMALPLQDSDVAHAPSPSFVTLYFVVIGLAIPTVVLAFLCYRLTRLRLASKAGQVVGFQDSFLEWVEKMNENMVTANATQAERFATLSKKIGEYIQEIGNTTLAQQNLQQVAVQQEFVKMREWVERIQKVAEVQKEELEQYKAGFRIALQREPINFICDLRDHLFRAQESAVDINILKKSLLDIDGLITHLLDCLDLKEISIPVGANINDAEYNGKWEIAGKVSTDSQVQVGQVSSITNRGYYGIVRTNDKVTKNVIRKVCVQVFEQEKL